MAARQFLHRRSFYPDCHPSCTVVCKIKPWKRINIYSMSVCTQETSDVWINKTQVVTLSTALKSCRHFKRYIQYFFKAVNAQDTILAEHIFNTGALVAYLLVFADSYCVHFQVVVVAAFCHNCSKTSKCSQQSRGYNCHKKAHDIWFRCHN